MRDIWFTSDPHYGHKLVSGLRGFSVDAHDETITRSYLESVKPGDKLYILGDLSISRDTDMWREPLSKVREKLGDDGEMHLIWGNHDAGWAGSSRAHKSQRVYLELFDSASMYGRIKYNEYEFLLSHLPYDGDSRSDPRYTQWRLRDEGVPIIHGHVHSPTQFKKSRRGTPQVNIGLEAWSLHPVKIDRIVEVTKKSGARK